MDTLRHFKQVQTLRLLAQDLAGRLPLETLSDHLSDLADMILDETLARCWAGLDAPPRHPALRRHRLRQAGRQGTRLRLRPRHHLPLRRCRRTRAGNLRAPRPAHQHLAHQPDVGRHALRNRPAPAPRRRRGLLVSSIEAFRDYQQHQAWVWEHQALTRARFVCGDSEIGASFEALRREVLARRATPASCATKCWRCARKCTTATPTTAACSTSSTTAAASSTSNSRAVPGAAALRRAPRTRRQRRQPRAAAARGCGGPDSRRRRAGRRRRLSRTAPSAACDQAFRRGVSRGCRRPPSRSYATRSGHCGRR